MKLSKDQVRKVAKLTNLAITEVEEEKYSEQLSKILDYIDQLNRVEPYIEVEPLFNVRAKSVTRPDEVKDSLTQDEALQNAANKRGGFFVTKGVFEDE